MVCGAVQDKPRASTMDGRAVIHGQTPAQDDDEEDEVVELSEDMTVDNDHDKDQDHSEDMVLSKEDFDVLQAFHRLVPLPALTSKILRVVCDEDLQVKDDHEYEIHMHSEEVPHPQNLLRSSSNPRSALAKHSPLTRRLSSKPTPRIAGSPIGAPIQKPHRAVDLATQTPRIKLLTSITSGDDRVG